MENNFNIKRAAFLVSSPFQAICAIEAVNYFKISDPDFYVQGTEVSHNKTRMLLTDKGYSYEDLESIDHRYTIKKLHNYKKYRYIFVGDYFSYGHFLLSMMWSTFGANIFYLDDGNSTLTLLSSVSRKRLDRGSLTTRAFYKFLLFLKNLKGVKRYFFTIYDVQGKIPFSVIKNEFSTLAKSHSKNMQQGVYIIGTNSSQLCWDKKEYIEKIKTIKSYINRTYPTEKIYYCPHRRDENNYEMECLNNDIELYNTRISVEVDFISNNVNPLVVLGFGSTALLTLKKIYSQSIFIDLIMHCLNTKTEKEYRMIEDVYQENGIKVIELDDLKLKR